MDNLKKLSALDDEEEKEETEEEEDKVIDNEDGTITQINKGEKTTESVLVDDIIPFDKFTK